MPDDLETFNLRSDLHQFGLNTYSDFRITGQNQLCINNLGPIIKEIKDLDRANERDSLASFVYVWVGYDQDTDRMRALHVGSTNDIERRFNEHIADLNNNVYPERTLGIQKIVNTNGRPGKVYIYGRVSASLEIFGMTLPGHAAEEAALIKQFKPYWNTEGNPHKRTLKWPPDDLCED